MLHYISDRLNCPHLHTATMFFYLASLLYPKYLAASPIWKERTEDFETEFCESAGQDEAFLHDCLYAFSLERLELALKDKYVATLFSFYAIHEEKHINSNKTMKQNKDAYRKAFSILRRHAEAAART